MALNKVFICAPEINVNSMPKLLQLFAWVYSIASRWEKAIQRADFYKYIIVYLWGGFYFDSDCLPGRVTLDTLLTQVPLIRGNVTHGVPVAILFVETELSLAQQRVNSHHRVRNGRAEDKVRIANYALGSDGVGHPFWLAVIIEASVRNFPKL